MAPGRLQDIQHIRNGSVPAQQVSYGLEDYHWLLPIEDRRAKDFQREGLKSGLVLLLKSRAGSQPRTSCQPSGLKTVLPQKDHFVPLVPRLQSWNELPRGFTSVLPFLSKHIFNTRIHFSKSLLPNQLRPKDRERVQNASSNWWVSRSI